MKKLWSVFWITEALIITGTLAAAIALWFANAPLGAVAGSLGTLAAAAYGLHFRSLGYSLENSSVVIQKGFIVRSRMEIPIGSVLIYREVTLFGRTLYTALSTAGETIVLYCRIDPDITSIRSE